MVRKVAKVGAVKTERNWSRSERKVGVSCMCGLLVARDPGCCATPRIHPWPKEDAIEHAYSPVARSAKPELRVRLHDGPRSCWPPTGVTADRNPSHTDRNSTMNSRLTYQPEREDRLDAWLAWGR